MRLCCESWAFMTSEWNRRSPGFILSTLWNFASSVFIRTRDSGARLPAHGRLIINLPCMPDRLIIASYLCAFWILLCSPLRVSSHVLLCQAWPTALQREKSERQWRPAEKRRGRQHHNLMSQERTMLGSEGKNDFFSP